MLRLAAALAMGLFMVSLTMSYLKELGVVGSHRVAPRLVPAAHAQVDPRLVGPTIQALQAQLSYMQALAKVQHDDDEARMATLWQWLIDAKPAEPKTEAK